ncbi:MAG: replicative DNA helicase [Opitutales bacterium]
MDLPNSDDRPPQPSQFNGRPGQNGRNFRDRPQLRLDGLTPPHSVDLEQALLACVILEGGGETLPICLEEKVKAESFYIPKHQVIFGQLLELFRKQQVIDEIILIDHLKTANLVEEAGGEAYVLEITNRIDSPAHLPFYIQRVRDGHLLRQLISCSRETIESAYSGIDEVADFLEKTEERFFSISQDRVTDSAKPLSGSLEKALGLVNEMLTNKGEITGAPTGFVDLDKLTTGWHSGEMIVVAARPSMGKTSLALNMAEAGICPRRGAATPTLMFSLEMPCEQLAMRLLCSRARVNMRKLRDGFLSPEKHRELFNTAKELQVAPLSIDDSSGLSIMELRAKARRWFNRVQKENERKGEQGEQPKVPGMVIIDYLQLVAGTDPKTPREQQIAEISRGCKAMAKELGVPVVVLAQLNRDSEREKRQPRMSDLRESGSIEQDADVVLLLSKPRNYDEQEDMAADAVARDLIIAKQRNGPVDTVPLTFTKHLTRFENYQAPAE